MMPQPYLDGLLSHLLTVGGFLLALFLVARLMSEKRQPGNTVAWLLGILLVPYVGVPLYLLFGGRKIKRLADRKRRICPVVPDAPAGTSAHASPIAKALTLNGAYPPVAGNRVVLHTSGVQAFEELETLIRGAHHTLHVMTFILGRDEVGRRVIELLAERARAGVKVRLLLDALGCFFIGKGFVRPLREAGGEVCWFMPVLPLASRGHANLRNHRKIAVADDRLALVGGRNLAREYLGPKPRRRRWRDFGATVEGPAALLLNEIFLADWSFASRQPIESLQRALSADATWETPAPRDHGRSETQVVASGPDVTGDSLYEGILALIQQAERVLTLVTPYFIPDEVLFRSIQVKARTGCRVRLIVPARSNHPVTDFARHYYVRELHRAGVEVLLHGPGMLHAKLITVDGRIGLLGSANLDLRSLFVNFEVGLFLYSAEDVAGMDAWIESLVESCRPYRPPRRSRLGLRTVAEELSRLLAPFF